MEAKEAQYAEVAKVFAFVLHQVRLYSENHPTSQLAVRNFSTKLQEVLDLETKITFGSVEDRLIINNCSLDSKNTGVQVLLNECRRLQIERLILEQGLTEEELRSLLNLMGLPPKTGEDRGGFKKVFEEANFQHIRLATGHYQVVGEEEEVVEKSDGGKETDGGKENVEGFPSQQVQRIERMEELIEYCLSGTEARVDFDFERLTYELERKPQDVASQMIHRAEDVERLRRIVEGVGRFLEQQLAEHFLRAGRDLSLAIYHLARVLKRSIEASEEFKGLGREMGGILERCADVVKLKLLTKAFVESGGDLKTLAKFLRSKEARERLKEPLKEKLSALGVREKDLDQLLAVKEETQAPKRSRQEDVTSEELAELRRLRDRFKEELDARVKEEVKVLEREKKRAVDEKERVDNIIRNIGEGLVVVDNEGRTQLMNPAAEKLLGIDQGEGKGVPVPRLLKGEHLLTMAKGPLRDDGDRITKEIDMKSVDDETRRVLQASTAVIENEDGKTVGMVSVLSDITKQKKLDEMKSKFVAHVSHELRTPLLAIEESLALLLGGTAGEVGPGQGKFLSIAQRNIIRLSRLINDLLDVAKLEAGKVELHPVSFEVKDMAHHVAETVRSLAEGSGVTIEERYPERGIEVEADPDRLTQVVTNLLGNAIKFTPEGGKVTLEVDSNRQDLEISQEPCVTISVQDTGAGISLEDQQRIFQKFEQGNTRSSKNVSSTGLGLTIAKEIVEHHGGKIWVESKEGEGSRFIFAIPRRFRNGANTERIQP